MQAPAAQLGQTKNAPEVALPAPQQVARTSAFGAVSMPSNEARGAKRHRLLDAVGTSVATLLDATTQAPAQASRAPEASAPHALATAPFPAVLRSATVADVQMRALPDGAMGAALTLRHPDFGQVELELRVQPLGIDLRAITQNVEASVALRASENLLRQRVARRGKALRNVRISTRDKNHRRRVSRRRGLDMEA